MSSAVGAVGLLLINTVFEEEADIVQLLPVQPQVSLLAGCRFQQRTGDGRRGGYCGCPALHFWAWFYSCRTLQVLIFFYAVLDD